MTLLNHHGCLEDALERAEAYARQAREAMAIFPDGPTKRALLDTLESSLVRSA
jgi:octaprenyl-diphosphate synthase